MYHDVELARGESGFQTPLALPYKTDRAVFQTHLGMIARGPARPATIFEVLASPQERHVLLTFDDGGNLRYGSQTCWKSKGGEGVSSLRPP